MGGGREGCWRSDPGGSPEWGRVPPAAGRRGPGVLAPGWGPGRQTGSVSLSLPSLPPPVPRSTPPQPGFISPEPGPCSVGWVGAGRGAAGERGLAFSFKAPPLPSQGAGSAGVTAGCTGRAPPCLSPAAEAPPRAGFAPQPPGPGPQPPRAGSAPALFAPLPLCPGARPCRSRPSPPRSPSLPSLSFSFE